MVMWIEATPLSGCFIAHMDPFTDKRGIFARFFCERELETILMDRHIVNVNFSHTKKKGSIRGMHYQIPPCSEMKFIRCTKGKVFDVAVDIRTDSDTFLHWHGVELSEDNMLMYVIPEGFAHGFQTLSDDTDIIYFVTEFYNKEKEGALHYLDPAIDINWPHPVSDISEKDSLHPFIDEKFYGIKIEDN